jgi:hypothetical protein
MVEFEVPMKEEENEKFEKGSNGSNKGYQDTQRSMYSQRSSMTGFAETFRSSIAYEAPQVPKPKPLKISSYLKTR